LFKLLALTKKVNNSKKLWYVGHTCNINLDLLTLHMMQIVANIVSML
jgi:hypothetical protein